MYCKTFMKIKRKRDSKEVRNLKAKIRRRMIQKVKPSNKIYKRKKQ